MHTQTRLAEYRIAELHTQAQAYRLAKAAKPERELRTRIGWTLVEVGLRLATPATASAPL
ncbi:hypothetical protein ACFV2H_27455 [Streptomyces sp. NPDC059629]|uniref:hypothetical protein n=1 Tax=Streptomyces sp. NPDC059629 TaxID=3346889 RepID=UPI0036A49104